MFHVDVRTKLEKLMPIGWMLVGMAFLYLFWVFVTRDLAWGPIEKRAEPLLPWLMGTEPKILAFYSAPELVRGEPGTICYGVLNIKAVRIEPGVEAITPSINRCIAISPKQTTAYTLYATGNDGKELTASFTVAVKPPPPAFLFVDVSTKELVKGDRYAICYGVKNATRVTLTPAVGVATPVVAKHCVMFFPQVSMNFQLTATGEDGRTETMKFPLKVVDRKK